MHIYRISNAFAFFGIDISREEAALFQSYYAQNQREIELDPEMKELLNKAKSKGIQLGIITNGPAEHQANKINQLQVKDWVDENNIFISGKLGVAKPSIEIFRVVENEMGIEPENTYYVGDSYRNDVIGAKMAGWNSIWINRRKHTIPSDMNYLPDYIIDDHSSPTYVLRTIMGK